MLLHCSALPTKINFVLSMKIIQLCQILAACCWPGFPRFLRHWGLALKGFVQSCHNTSKSPYLCWDGNFPHLPHLLLHHFCLFFNWIKRKANSWHFPRVTRVLRLPVKEGYLTPRLDIPVMDPWIHFVLLNQESLRQRWCMLEAGEGGPATKAGHSADSTDISSRSHRAQFLLEEACRCGNRCCRLALSMAVSGVGWLRINNHHPAVAVNQGLNLWQAAEARMRHRNTLPNVFPLSHFCIALT